MSQVLVYDWILLRYFLLNYFFFCEPNFCFEIWGIFLFVFLFLPAYCKPEYLAYLINVFPIHNIEMFSPKIYECCITYVAYLWKHSFQQGKCKSVKLQKISNKIVRKPTHSSVPKTHSYVIIFLEFQFGKKQQFPNKHYQSYNHGFRLEIRLCFVCLFNPTLVSLHMSYQPMQYFEFSKTPHFKNHLF